MGWGRGRIARWDRRAVTRYTDCWPRKGDLRRMGRSAGGAGEDMRAVSMLYFTARRCGGRRLTSDRSGGHGKIWTTRGGSQRISYHGRTIPRSGYALLIKTNKNDRDLCRKNELSRE